MMLLAAIAAGGAVGALLRYGLSGWIQHATAGPFPWGTAAVNLVGSLLIGVCWETLNRNPSPPEVRGFLVVGLLGGFTTFSTFSLEIAMLAKAGDLRLALLNVLSSNVICVCAVLLGLAGAHWILDITGR